MRPAKIVAIVIGAILVLLGLGLLAPGGFLLWAYGTQRDANSYFESSARNMSTSGYALTAPRVDVHIGSGLDWMPRGAAASVRIRAASTTETAVFVGIGPTLEVDRYLGGVERDEVTSFGWGAGSVRYEHVAGGAPPSPPGEQDFWVASSEGFGSQLVEWDVLDGNWTFVVMNADASRPVSAAVSLGARFDILYPIGVGLTAGGVILLAVGILLIVLGARRPRRPSYEYPTYAAPGQWSYPPSGPGQATPPTPPAGAPRQDPQGQEEESS